MKTDIQIEDNFKWKKTEKQKTIDLDDALDVALADIQAVNYNGETSLDDLETVDYNNDTSVIDLVPVEKQLR